MAGRNWEGVGLAFTADLRQTEAGRLYNCPEEDETRAPLQKASDDADYEHGEYIRAIRSTPVRGPRKCSQFFGPILKASMVGFTLYSRALTTICVDEVKTKSRPPVPARPPSGKGNATGGYNLEAPFSLDSYMHSYNL